MKNKYNRNPKGINQWEVRTNAEIQKIINSYPVKWTKRDFRGEGKYNSQKILTRKETEKPGLKFSHTGNKKHLEEVIQEKRYPLLIRLQILNYKGN